MNKQLPIIPPPETNYDDGASRNPFSPFRVTKWREHPSQCYGCFVGEDFAGELEALQAFDTDDTNYHVRYMALNGPGVYQVRVNRFYDPKRIAQSGDGIGFEPWFKEGEELTELAPLYP